MIENVKFEEFDDSSNEGKLLLAAISVLTSIDVNQIKKGEYGGMCSPNEVMKKLTDIANKMYYDEEYRQFIIIKNRDEKINSLLDINKKTS